MVVEESYVELRTEGAEDHHLERTGPNPPPADRSDHVPRNDIFKIGW